MRRLIKIFVFCALSSIGSISTALALTFILPSNGDNVVGQVQWTQALPGDNFSLLGRRYGIGYYELIEANPSVNPLNPGAGTIIVIPSRFVLPATPHQGIVVNLAELRLYYYPPNRRIVFTYPVGIGREGDGTPLGPSRIVQKVVDPIWYVPKSIRLKQAKRGVILPTQVPPGPSNPLGKYAMLLAQPGYLMHGTNDYRGVGLRSSSGCLRLFPEDIEALFHQVQVGTPVHIISVPYKVGWDQGQPYLEAHVPLQEQQFGNTSDLETLINVVHSTPGTSQLAIDWGIVRQVAHEQNGIPQAIAGTSLH